MPTAAPELSACRKSCKAFLLDVCLRTRAPVSGECLDAEAYTPILEGDDRVVARSNTLNPVRRSARCDRPVSMSAQRPTRAALGAVTPVAAILAFVDPELAKDENCTALLKGAGSVA